MLDFITDYAIKNVWCSPYQDMQAIIQLRRATPVGGRRSYFEYGRQRYALPDANYNYHVYSLGQTSPLRLNLPQVQQAWIKVSDLMASRDLLIDLYNDSGRQYPRALSYVIRTEDKTYLLAVPVLKTLPSLDTEHLFIRFYSNRYFKTTHRPEGEPGIQVQGGVVASAGGGLALQQAYHAALDLPGHAYAFHNGVFVSDFIPGSYSLGDVLEWVYDPSIEEVVDFSYDTTPTFTSVLDSKQKFFLHPQKGTTQSIRYCDDVDVFVLNTVAGKQHGVYCHKNVVGTLRMVTHNDYSLATSVVETIRQTFPTWGVSTQLKVRLHIRKSPPLRPVIQESRALRELYALNDEQIVSAIVGIDSTIPEWRAAALESSLYTQLMATDSPLTLKSSIPALLGYDSIANLVGTPWVPVESNVALVPLGYQTYGTAFEYDTYGVLLGWRTYTAVDTYVPFYFGCTAVEFVSGTGQLAQDYTYSNAAKTLDPTVGYRFYVSGVELGASDQKWVDVTGDNSKYTVDASGVVSWTLDPAYEIGLVKGDSTFHCYDLTLSNTNYVFEFTLTLGGLAEWSVLPGKLDLWLNGRALVPTVDYYLSGKRVVIVNRDFLRTDGQPQAVTVRGTGFCVSGNKPEPSLEVGFVQHRALSVNDYYNVRGIKPTRVVVGGRRYDPRVLKYEESQDITPPVTVVNGQPYCIDDALVPLRGLSPYDTYALRPTALEFDQRLGNYLNAKLPPPEYDNPSFIPQRYTVVSPVTARILRDLVEGVLTPLPSNASGQAVDLAITPYKPLFEFDPCVVGFDEDYVVVVAHPWLTTVDVTQDAYGFLERVIKTYLKDLVDLTPSVRII